MQTKKATEIISIASHFMTFELIDDSDVYTLAADYSDCVQRDSRDHFCNYNALFKCPSHARHG